MQLLWREQDANFFKDFSRSYKMPGQRSVAIVFSLDNVHLKTTLTVTFKEALVK